MSDIPVGRRGRIVIRENGSSGHNVYLISKSKNISQFLGWEDGFDIARALAIVEEMKRQTPSKRFEGKKRIARLMKYATGLRYSWKTVTAKLGIPW